VPHAITARIQEAHLLIGHTLCGLIEAELDVGQ
jgi:D-sedoheptulose 7-phosphate isomerase